MWIEIAVWKCNQHLRKVSLPAWGVWIEILLDFQTRTKHIAPIIPAQDDDVMARFFDQKMYGIMYDYLIAKDITTKAVQVEEAYHWLFSQEWGDDSTGY